MCVAAYQWVLLRKVVRSYEIQLGDLEHTDRKLIAANRDLEQFAYTASHDLREPLRTIRSFLAAIFEDIDSDVINDEIALYRDTVFRAVDRSNQLVDDLLRFSRAGTNLHLEHFQIGEIMMDVQESVLSSVDDSVVVVDVSMVGLHIGAFGDKSLLRMVVANIVRNAVKFRIGDQLKICMRAWSDKDSWFLSVSDNGIGIETEFFERIFDVFQRLHSRDDYPGTGIGLALCRRVCAAHGGSINVESGGNNKGSTFTIEIPL